MASPAPQAVQQTVRRWLADYIVGLRLCPYAAPVLQQTLILQARPQQSPAEAVTAASTVLSNDPTTTAAPVTALVVLPQRRYRRLSPFVRAAEAADQALATAAPQTKLAFFHPRMQHTAGSEAEQPEDFAGRGPFPMLHVLRVCDLVRVESQGLPHGQQVSDANNKRLRRLGLPRLQQLLAEVSAGEAPPAHHHHAARR